MVPFFQWVGAESAPKVGLVVHGVLGSGHNFRSFVKRLTELRPEYRFALVDLRHHGKSQGAPPPHTIEACAGDLLAWSESVGKMPELVIGHSLGGKVALAFGRRVMSGAAMGEGMEAEALRQVWALDSNPGIQVPGGAHQVRSVMQALRENRGPFETRAEVVELMMARGLSSGLANWLVTNLEKKGESYAWRLDLDAIDELLDDYFGTDYWPFLRSVAARGAGTKSPLFHLLVAEHSDRWSGTMREQAERLPQDGSFRLHELEQAGHWVHVDNPDGLLRILTSQF